MDETDALTVDELIEKLEEFDGDCDVWAFGYEVEKVEDSEVYEDVVRLVSEDG